MKKIYELCERIGELISPQTIGVASKHIHKSVGKFMKKILSFIIVISCLLLTAHGTSSSVPNVLEVTPNTNAEVSSCYFSKTESITDFRSILAANSIQCPPIASSTLSGNPSFGNSFLPYSVLIKYNHSLHKAQWNIRCDVDFTSNDLVQAHYYVFALRRILI